LLWSHESRRTYDCTSGSDPTSQSQFGNSKIHNFGSIRTIINEKYIGGFQVAVNDPARMSGPKRFGNAPSKRQRIVNRHAASKQCLLEVLTVQPFHDEVTRAVRQRAAVEQSYDAWMLKRVERCDFAIETTFIVCVTVEQDLDRDALRRAFVSATIHFGRASCACKMQDFVTISD